MPIEFAPPSPQLQGFNIPPPQYTDPLQTLAQLGQLRTQNLQRQGAQQELELQQQKMESNKGLLAAFAQGGTFDQVYENAAKSGKVLPGDLIALKEHRTKLLQDAAALDKTTRELQAADIDRLRGLYEGVTDQSTLAEANARADQLGIGKNVPRFTQYSDPEHLKAFNNSLRTHSQVMDEAGKQATKEKEEAGTKLTGVQTTEAEQKVDAANLAAARAALQSAPKDPATGTPTPAAVAEIRAQYSKVKLPQGNAPKADWERFLTGDLSTKERIELDRPKSETDLAVIANDPNRTPQEREQATNALKALRTQKDKAGVDYPKPPEVEEQEKRLIRERALANRSGAGLTPSQSSQLNSLARSLDNHPIIKQYNIQNDRYNSMNAILQRGLGGPADLALIYEFMKAEDPTSVVRPSEYDAAAKSGNIFAGALAKFNGFLKPEGGFMPPQVKDAFLQIVEAKRKVSRGEAAKLYQDFSRRGDVIIGQPGMAKNYFTDYANLYEDTPAATGGTGQQAPPAGGGSKDNPQASPGAPPIGHIDYDTQGRPHKYIGGNHRDPSNWPLVQSLPKQ